MSLENRLEATAKNLEGKVQEAIGDLTGDQKQRVEGQIKQMEASTLHTKENLKDEAKQLINRA